jgi:ribosomal protein S18 acetylase RimI-like enzyme
MVTYTQRPARSIDEAWLDKLRRAAYKRLFDATWGAWDENRHQRHFSASLQQGGISIIEIDGEPVGMLQIRDEADVFEIAEIQIYPRFQRGGIGRQVLLDTLSKAHKLDKDVRLSLGLRNEDAYRLYQSLGFQEIKRTDTHIHMLYTLVLNSPPLK